MNMVFMSDTENETCIINMRIILSITTHVGSNIHTYRFNNDFKILEYNMGKKHLPKDLYRRIFFIKSQNQFMQAGYTLAPNKQRK